MSESLRLVLSKLDRAEKHLDDLKAEFLHGRKPGQPFDTILGKPQRQGQEFTTIAHVVKPRLEWSLAAGDVVHNARCALDHLVYRLVMRHPDKVTSYLAVNGQRKLDRVVHFPVYKESDDFKSNWKVRDLQTLLTTDEFAAIKEAQPYERTPAAPVVDRIWILHTLNNIDKHRTILVVDKRFAVRGTIGGKTVGGMAKVEETGTYVFSFPIPPDAPEGEMNVDMMSAHILFDGTGVCDRQPMIECLRGLIRDVRELVVAKFSTFLA